MIMGWLKTYGCSTHSPDHFNAYNASDWQDMRSGMVSYPDWSDSIEDMLGLGLVPDCCHVSYDRIYHRINKVRRHLRRWSMTRLHRRHITKMEILSGTSRIWKQYLQQDLVKAYQAAQFRFNECSPWVQIRDLGTQRDPQGLMWSDIERQCNEMADIPCMIHFGSCYSPTLGKFLTRVEMALDAAQANTPTSASFPMYGMIATCSYPAICCELRMRKGRRCGPMYQITLRTSFSTANTVPLSQEERHSSGNL